VLSVHPVAILTEPVSRSASALDHRCGLDATIDAIIDIMFRLRHK